MKLWKLTYRDKFQASKGLIAAADLPEAFAVGRQWCLNNSKTFVGVESALLADASILVKPDVQQAPNKEE